MIYNQNFEVKIYDLMMMIVWNRDDVVVVVVVFVEDERKMFLDHFDLNELKVEVMAEIFLMEFRNLYL
jgi:hypothetical protein